MTLKLKADLNTSSRSSRPTSSKIFKIRFYT